MKGLSKKIIACLLTGMILFMCCGFAEIGSFFIGSVQAATEIDQTSVNTQKDDEGGTSQAKQDVYVVKELEDKRDEYTTVYLNNDGSYAAKFYSTPVRYKDENGKLTDIDTSITEINDTNKTADTSGYKYKTKASPVSTYLPDTIKEQNPILVKKEDYSVSLLPVISSKSNDVKDLQNASDLQKDNKNAVTANNGALATEKVKDLYDKELKQLQKYPTILKMKIIRMF